MAKQTTDPLLLQAALVGLQQMQADIDSKIADLRHRLGTTSTRDTFGTPGPGMKVVQPRKRRMSASGRRRIALAQKKRWAEYHKARQEAATTAKRAPKSGRRPAGKAKA